MSGREASPELPAIDRRKHDGIRLVLLFYFPRILDRAINEPLKAGVGSLLDPRRSVAAFVHKDLHADPADFREFVIAEFWEWMQLCFDRERPESLAGVAARFFERGFVDA